MRELADKKDRMEKAKEAEGAGELDRAAMLYEQVLQEDNLEEQAFG